MRKTGIALRALALAALAALAAAQSMGDRIAQLSTGVVMVVPVGGKIGSMVPIGTSGSGTFINRLSGLILTNYHVVFDDGAGAPAEEHLIFVSRSIDEMPVPAYLARLVSFDEALDIAVLRIEEDIADPPIPLASLFCFDYKSQETWKSVQAVKALDPVYVLGYPSTGDGTITITKGLVSGFTAPEDWLPFKRQFIKSDVNLSFGNSGGTALDEAGRFVGIPTRINNQGGGIMGLIRSADLALPVIEAAMASAQSKPAKASANAGPAAPAGKFVLAGVVRNAHTKKPIAGAQFYVLKPKANPHAFVMTMDESLLFAHWETGANGTFRIEGLEFDQRYPVICHAEGYRFFVDSNGVKAEAGGPTVLESNMDMLPE